MANATQQLFKDDEEERREARVPSDDELRHLTGIGKDEESELDQAATDGAAKDLIDRENGAVQGSSQSSSPDDQANLKSAESNPSDFSFDPTNSEHRGNLRRVINAASSSRRGLLIGGGAGASIIAIVVVIFFMLIPLKIEHIMSNLQSKYFATSEGAVQKETDNMLSRYVKTAVLPALTRCSGSTINKDCNPRFGTSANPVTNMYKGWSDARLENKLATDYGIEFRYDKHTNKYYMKAPGISGANGLDISKFEGTSGNLFDEIKRPAIRQSVRDAIQNETRWKRVMYRYKVGRLLEEKYGIKRCVIFCGTKDALANFKDEKKNAWKLYATQRFIVPHTKTLGIVLECLFNSTCNPVQTNVSADDGTNGALHGTPENPAVEGETRTTLDALAASYGLADDSTIKKMIEDYKGISDKGMQRWLIDEILKKFGKEELSSRVADAAPVIGWIHLGSDVINGLNKAGPTVRKLTYVTNSAAAAQAFSMFLSYVSELHTGHVDPTEIGSMVGALGPSNDGTASSEQPLGGTAGAEQSPLYQSLMSSPAASPSVASLISTKASADTTSTQNSHADLCNDGKPVPSGKLVCPEEVLGQGNGALDDIHSILNQPGISYITEIASKTSGFLGSISNLFGDIINKIPGLNTIVGSLSDLVSKIVSPFFEGLVKKIIPNPYGPDMSGARTYDTLAAGADVAGNDTAHYALGGQKLTDSQVAAIENEQKSEARQAFNHSSFFARMLDTSSEYSLVTKLATAIPLGYGSGARESFANLLSGPFIAITHGFSSFFSTKAGAFTNLQTDPFKVPQYGYPDGTIPDDPESYWNQHCSDNAGQAYQNDQEYSASGWAASAANPSGDYSSPTLDPDTGMPVNKTTNPCLLIKASTGSAGGFFDSSLLTPDDLATANGQPVNPTTTASSTIDTTSLYKDSSNVACSSGTRNLGIQDGYYNGQKVPIRICAVPNLPSTGEESNGGYGITGANGDAIVNSVVSGAVYAMVSAAAQDGVKLTAISSYRTMAHQEALCPCDGVHVAQPGYSNHQMGLAIDFGGGLPSTPGPIPGNQFWDWLSKNAGIYGYKNYVNEAWHWSPTGH